MLDQFIPEFPITKIEEIHSAERAQLRTCLNVVFFIKRLVVNINLKQKLLQDALRHSMTYLKQSFLNQSESVANTSWIKNTLTSLRNLSPQLNELTTKMIKIEDVLQKRRSAFDLEFLNHYWLKTGCMESDHCVPTITNLANHTQEISTRLLDSTNRDNLDKFQELDKSRFLENCKKAGELITKHCQPNAIRLYSEFQEASEKVWTQRKIFQASNGELKVFSNLLEKYQSSKFTKDLNKEMFHDNNEDLIFHMMKRVQNLSISIQECTEDVKTLGKEINEL
ncbi:uncharacterized protein LOC115231772 [Octopus sinensis]|uniref:Uncharacterized protein LOC115231772 n=1 Tax=Octopus sinensis TaxID=2607531 RepID=A0A6P7U0Q6_9MOLL|nr:uncharacterized protein LOC115231772 [Octopus sinensis]